MKKLFLIFLLAQSIESFGQRSNGFFVQELCFVDPDLLRAFKIDKFEIEIFENNRKKGTHEIFLDSNQRMIKQVADLGDSVDTRYYESTIISQFACPIVRPAFIKTCESGRITHTENDGAYRMTSFDTEGKVISERWMPGGERLEIKRQFVYTKEGLLDTMKMEDIKKDGSIDKKELLLYSYTNEHLVSIQQLISFTGDYREAGLLRFKDLDCGLVKQMQGTGYFGQYKVKVNFKYFSKGKQVK